MPQQQRPHHKACHRRRPACIPGRSPPRFLRPHPNRLRRLRGHSRRPDRPLRSLSIACRTRPRQLRARHSRQPRHGRHRGLDRLLSRRTLMRRRRGPRHRLRRHSPDPNSQRGRLHGPNRRRADLCGHNRLHRRRPPLRRPPLLHHGSHRHRRWNWTMTTPSRKTRWSSMRTQTSARCS
jgi:hypothetical protein